MKIYYPKPPEYELEFEEEYDPLVAILQEMAFHQSPVIYRINPPEMQKLITVFKQLQQLYGSATVTYGINDLFSGLGWVEMLTPNLKMSNTTQFVKLCRLASTVDVVPRIGGVVQITFGFDEITVAVKEEDEV